MASNRNNHNVRRADLIDGRNALRQRDKANNLKNQAHANKKAEKWMNSIVGQKFVLRLKNK